MIRSTLRAYHEVTEDGRAEPIKILFHGRYIHGLLNSAAGTAGVVLMGGAGGGMHGPASIYADLGDRLARRGIETLRIDPRYPNDLITCTEDVLAAVEYLAGRGKNRFGVVGWSFGGAVVIEAAARDPRIATIVTIATQSYGTQNVWRIAPRSILLLHGKEDRALPWRTSQDVYDRAEEPKRLVLFPNGNHSIDQHRQEMFDLVRDWLVEHLEP